MIRRLVGKHWLFQAAFFDHIRRAESTSSTGTGTTTTTSSSSSSSSSRSGEGKASGNADGVEPGNPQLPNWLEKGQTDHRPLISYAGHLFVWGVDMEKVRTPLSTPVNHSSDTFHVGSHVPVYMRHFA